MTNNQRSEHHHNPGEKRLVSGELKIHGGIQVHGTEDAAKKHEAERSKDETYKKATERFENRSLLVSGIALLVSAAYFVVTILIFNQTAISNESSDRTLKALQRAYVFPGERQILPTSLDDKGKFRAIDIRFTWGNSGNTPTRNMTTHINQQPFPLSGIPDNFTFPDSWKEGDPHVNTPAILGPHADPALTGVNIGPITLGDLEVFKRPRQFREFFWGWAKYNDIFEGTATHITEVCYELTGVISRPNDLPYLVFSNCDRHNCTDTECADYENRTK